MKSGYDQFFKQVKKTSNATSAAQSKKVAKAPGVSSQRPAPQSAEELKQLVQNRTRQLALQRQRRMNRRFPLSAAISLAAFLSLGVLAYQQQEAVVQAFESVEIKLFGTASASASQAAKPASENAKKAESAAPATEEAVAAKPAGTSLTEEELNLFKGLQQRAQQLDQREAELKKMEEELQQQKEALEKRLADIEGVRRNIASQLEEKVKVDKERVEQLVQFYSTMKPQQAAKIIESLNEDLAVEILVRMKKKSAAEIMNLVASDKAQRLSEKFAGYKLKSRSTASSKETEP